MEPNKKIEVIIIEGCDLAGKSTLFEAVIKAFPGVGIKITDRPRDKSHQERKKIKDHYRSILSYININYQSKTIILDRFYPSEMVYSLPKRGYEALHDEDFIILEKTLHHRKHILLYCDPGVEALMERLALRGDDYIKKEDILQLHDRYDYFLKNTTLNVLRLDTKLPVVDLIEQIKQNI